MELTLVGMTLGSYELVELAGQGGMATVYKAYQETLDRWVAVKVLHTHNTELLTRFDREAKAVAKLHHPNILPIYEYGIQDDCPYIVMELIEQGTLQDRLESQRLTANQVATLTAPIAEALHYAHEQGLVHRDIKPSNILLPKKDWPLLTDFGLVKVKNSTDLITASDIVLGTPPYMSPEQVMGKKIDKRADMYALGIMMFEMVTGRLPFEYSNLNIMMLAHVSEPPPNPRDINPDCPEDLQKIILKTLRKAPDDRYADMQALAEALNTFANAAEATLSLSPAAPASSPSDLPPTEETLLRKREVDTAPPHLLISRQNATVPLPTLSSKEESLLIGRTKGLAQVDINLTPYSGAKAGVSRQHARLTAQDKLWLLTDLGSTNGTYVNEVKLIPGMSVRLNHGDEIRFGGLACIFVDES